MANPNSAARVKTSRSIAVVSGKGGSGKTMIATAMAQVFVSFGLSVALIDADTGTAGMTYYLGLKQVRNIRGGLYSIMKDLASSSTHKDPVSKNSLEDVVSGYLQDVTDLSRTQANVGFLPIGDHRRLSRDERSDPDNTAHLYTIAINQAIGELSELSEYVIVDCRGGVDRESLEVCAAVNDILLIAESDTTSFQASRHLVEVLSDAQLDHKLRGFIVNKAFEDPTSIARNGTSMFGAQYLGSVPFDFEATRAFLIGNIPRPGSIFATHVQDALSRAYPLNVMKPDSKIWTADDYNALGLPANEDSARGGYAATLLLVSAGAVFLINDLLPTPIFRTQGQFNTIAIAILVVLGLCAGIEPIRRIFGRLIESMALFAPSRRYRHK